MSVKEADEEPGGMSQQRNSSAVLDQSSGGIQAHSYPSRYRFFRESHGAQGRLSGDSEC